MWDVEDTIAAIATGRSPAARGIVRVSGRRTLEILASVVRGPDWPRLSSAPAQVSPAWLHAGDRLGEIPVQLYVWPTLRSYTRQPAAEIHTFGSPPILDAILRSLTQAGARLARPGEFTLRAFLAGRLDLTQAEAVLGVIEARSQAELEVALQQLAGGLATPLHALREQLLDLLAHLEAGLDFVEEDIQFIAPAELDRQLGTAIARITALSEQLDLRSEAAGEPRVVLRGLPNSGKSSLFNALAEGARSIVSPIASTTRDYVVAAVPVGARQVQLVDTAGVESASEEPLRGAAQQMTELQRQRSDLELLCLDGSRPLTPWEEDQLAAGETGSARLVVLTKSDLPRRAQVAGEVLATSSHLGSGLAELRQAIAARIEATANQESAVVATTAVRCGESLRLAAESLSRARQLGEQGGGEELVAAELRVALDHLGLVVGVVCTDDILDRIFSRFCIGK